jgi:hypothetical protein
MGEPTNYLTLTDAVIRNTTMPPGKAQHYLHDDKLPGLALRMRDRRPDLGLPVHQAGGERHSAQDARGLAKVQRAGGPEGRHHRRWRGG